MRIDSLEDVLDRADPATSVEIPSRTVRQVVAGTRRLANRGGSRGLRIALTAGLAIAIAGGGSVAAIANDDVRDWFLDWVVQDPYVSFQYVAPSGAVCTQTSGDPISPNPDAASALRDWLATAELGSLIDVDGALVQLRSSEEYDRSQIGSDSEYGIAVEIAVVLAAREELASRGFSAGSIDQWKSNLECTEPTS